MGYDCPSFNIQERYETELKKTLHMNDDDATHGLVKWTAQKGPITTSNSKKYVYLCL